MSRGLGDVYKRQIWDQVLHQYISSGLVTGQKSPEMWIDVGTPKRLNLVNSAYNSDQ